MSPPRLDQPFVSGTVRTPVGDVPQVTSTLTRSDRWGSIKARWSVGRMNFSVDPGLYALGNPNDTSSVFVTANYKMSFDRLREALPGHDAWILVLDTKGINVWCAAGKGSFGTEELVRRIESAQLAKVVSHRELILPQLGAPGIAAYQIKKRSGFKAVYGPIRAADLPAFMEAGLKAAPEMRRKSFKIRERAVLIPVELVSALKWAVIILPVLFILSGFGGSGSFWGDALNSGIFAVFAGLMGVVSGAILTPLLLPWLPGRAFSLKGLIMGLFTAGILILLRIGSVEVYAGRLEMIAWFFLIPAISAYLGMNFTGASTYTSLSGVRKEMKWAVPLEIGACVVGLCFWIGSRFIA